MIENKKSSSIEIQLMNSPLANSPEEKNTTQLAKPLESLAQGYKGISRTSRTAKTMASSTLTSATLST